MAAHSAGQLFDATVASTVVPMAERSAAVTVESKADLSAALREM